MKNKVLVPGGTGSYVPGLDREGSLQWRRKHNRPCTERWCPLIWVLFMAVITPVQVKGRCSQEVGWTRVTTITRATARHSYKETKRARLDQPAKTEATGAVQGVNSWEGENVFNCQGNVGRRMNWHKVSRIITCWSIEEESFWQHIKRNSGEKHTRLQEGAWRLYRKHSMPLLMIEVTNSKTLTGPSRPFTLKKGSLLLVHIFCSCNGAQCFLLVPVLYCWTERKWIAEALNYNFPQWIFI